MFVGLSGFRYLGDQKFGMKRLDCGIHGFKSHGVLVVTLDAMILHPLSIPISRAFAVNALAPISILFGMTTLANPRRIFKTRVNLRARAQQIVIIDIVAVVAGKLRATMNR